MRERENTWVKDCYTKQLWMIEGITESGFVKLKDMNGEKWAFPRCHFWSRFSAQ